ncbi:MAG: hypothetical protein JWM50_2446 [Microbacteriaceae bacterium]|jgi:hypothetical protein|nr:hypothetical protein [Microbacteriaceae bacterium]
MKNALLLVVGVGIGFVAAHRVSRTPTGQQFFAAVNDRADGLKAAVVDGYREREARLRAAISRDDDGFSAPGRHAD